MARAQADDRDDQKYHLIGSFLEIASEHKRAEVVRDVVPEENRIASS